MVGPDDNFWVGPVSDYTTPVTGDWDHSLKLRRAYHHLEDLESKVGDWFDGSHHSSREEPDPNTANQVFVLASAEKPPADPFSLIIGECLHNLRSSLDVLAYELAVAYTAPAPIAKEIAQDSQFPIIGDEDRKGRGGKGPGAFADRGRRSLRGIHPKALTLIERIQPYNRGVLFREDALWQLNELDNLNKHRLLHTVASASSVAMFAYDDIENLAVGTVPDIDVYDVCPVETDTRIARYVAMPADPNLPVKMNLRPALQVAFDGVIPEVNGKAAAMVLAHLYEEIRARVLPSLERFLV